MIDGIKLVPSILAADLTRLGEQVREAAGAGADLFHVDVMDGRFVPNISFGVPVAEAVRRVTDLPVGVHLMIEEPERQVPAFAGAGVNTITFHAEATADARHTARMIHDLGLRCGLALNPPDPLDFIEDVLSDVDLVLLMTVNPGWSGQEFLREVLPKIRHTRQVLDARGLTAELAVDGGINADTVSLVVEAGARMLVVGSAVFRHPPGIGGAMALLQDAVRRASRPG